MPRLIREILIDILKELIQVSDQEAVIKFGISGRKSLEILVNFFTSVSNAHLCKTHILFGWGKQLTKFEFNKIYSKALIRKIGNNVKELYLGYNMALYQPLLDKIISEKQLISFSCGTCSRTFLDEFLPLFSATLKHVEIQGYKMTKIFRDSLNLETLSVTGTVGDEFHLNCCKTSSLKFSCYHGGYYTFLKCSYALLDSNEKSPHIASIEDITITGKQFFWSIDELKKITHLFPAFKYLKCKFTFDAPNWKSESIEGYHHIYNIIQPFIKTIKVATIVPVTAIFIFSPSNRESHFPHLEDCKKTCSDFEFDDTNPGFYCFRKMLSSAGPQFTRFEVQISK